MRKIGLLCFNLLVVTLLMAQQPFTDPNAEVRQVKGFHAIKVGTGIQLVLTQGNTEAVAVSAPEVEHRDKIKTTVENGVLKIWYDNDTWKFWKKAGNRKLKAYVSIVKITGLDISSGSSTTVEGALNSDKLEIDVSSGASFNGKVTASELGIDQSSGASVTIAGSTGKLKVDVSSGGRFRGYDLTTDYCDADASSGALLEITVNKELSAEASSGGSVHYRGNGHVVKVSTSSGGNVTKK